MNQTIELIPDLKAKQPLGILKRTDGNTKCVQAHFVLMHQDRIEEFKMNESIKDQQLSKKISKETLTFKSFDGKQ